MRGSPLVRIKLPSKDSKQLEELLSGGLQPVRVVRRALALRQLDQGQTAPAMAANLGLSVSGICKIRDRYQEGGLERALYEKQRPGAKPLLNEGERQRIIAMVCSEPPAGQARWTVRLLAEEAVKRKLVPQVGRETIRVLLENHDLQPWREKNVVRGGTR